jgi:hypothetical protein
MKLREVVKKSLRSPQFYANLAKEPLSFSINYFYSLVLLLSLTLSIVLSLVLVPGIQLFVKQATSVANALPDNFHVTITNGVATSSVPSPYFVPLPDELKSVLNDAGKSNLDNFLVVDTSSTFSNDKFASYKTLLWLTKDKIVGAENTDSLSETNLTTFPNADFTKSLLQSYAAKGERFLRWLPAVMLLGIFFLSMIVLSFLLLYYFLGAIFVIIVARIKRVPMKYVEAYKVAIHTSTFGLILWSLLFVLFFPAPPFSFITTLSVSIIFFSWWNLETPRLKELPPAKTA